MRQLMPDLRNSGTVLLLVGLALSVAILTSMLSLAEPARQQALELLPRPDVDSGAIVRTHGTTDIRKWPITHVDMEAIRDLDFVIASSRWAASRHSGKHTRRHTSMLVIGTDQDYNVVFDTALSEPGFDQLTSGRMISAEDVADHSRVCVLSGANARDLGVDAAGEAIRIDGLPFMVIGLTSDEGTTMIPATTYERLFGDDFNLTMLVKSEHPELEKALQEHLQALFKTDDGFQLRFRWSDTHLMAQTVALRRLLMNGLIGAVPLAVSFCGALGIALVWVRERMWNYALLRALGATRLQVGLGAIVEPFVIASCAAAAGLICGWLLCSFLHMVTGLEVAYNWRWFAAAWAAGLAAMVLPATYVSLRAAFVPPAEALRV